MQGVFSLVRLATDPAAARPALRHLLQASRGRAVSSPTSRVLPLRSSGVALGGVGGAVRRRARRRPGSARPALPSLRGPPARQPSQGCPRGPLAGMTAPERSSRAHLPEDSYGRGPRDNPAHRAPQIRGHTAEGALPPGGNWTLTVLLRLPTRAKRGPPR